MITNADYVKARWEDIAHVISSCPKMSSRYYLQLRHDLVGKYVYEQMRKKDNQEAKITYDSDNSFFRKVNSNTGGTSR